MLCRCDLCEKKFTREDYDPLLSTFCYKCALWLYSDEFPQLKKKRVPWDEVITNEMLFSKLKFHKLKIE